MTEKKLRPYQKDIIDTALKTKGNVLIQAPTGSGKTFIAEKIITHHRSKQLRCLFLAPKLNLLHQTTNAFKELNPQVIHSSNQKGFDKSRYAFVSTIQTMSRRIELFDEIDFDYVVLDEMHYGAKGKMQEIIKKAHDGSIIGLSATPYDQDGKLLNDDFDVVIDDYDTKYMVEEGYLVNIRAYEAFTPNLEGVKTKRKDWDLQELDIRLNQSKILTKIVSATKNIIKKRERTIVFCINISHAEAMSEAYNSVGLKASVTHSKLKKDIQKKRMEEFKEGKLDVLVSVDQLTTGFDVPATDTIVLARPTQSQNLYKQIVGRALRLSPETNKKEALLLDCGGVVSRLGMPLDPIVEREVSLINTEKKPYSCDSCNSIKPRVFSIKEDHMKVVTACPDCEEEREFKPKFIYQCDSCNRYYDFKSDKDYFKFENENMALQCSCGIETHFGSLDDDEIAFKDLSKEEQLHLDRLRASSWFTSKETLNELSKNEDKSIRRAVANNISTSKETLIQMAKDDFESIAPISDFLNHNEIDTDDLLDIIEYKKDDVKAVNTSSFKYFLFQIITHKKCSLKIIKTIAQYKNVYFLEELAKSIKSYTKKALPKRHYMEKTKYEIFPLNKTDIKNVERLLDILSYHENDDVKRNAISNDSISIKTLEKLYQDGVGYRSIAQNAKTPMSLLKKLASDKDYWVRLSISRRKLDKDVQLILAKSKEDDIRANLLKSSKAKDLFFACLESIPNPDETVVENKNSFDNNRVDFVILIQKSRYFKTDEARQIIETKHPIYKRLLEPKEEMSEEEFNRLNNEFWDKMFNELTVPYNEDD